MVPAVRDGTHLMGQQGAGVLTGGVVVLGQPVVAGCLGHRPRNGVVLRQGIGGCEAGGKWVYALLYSRPV